MTPKTVELPNVIEEGKLSRLETAIFLFDAVSDYYRKKRYSVHSEVGVLPWGKCVADLVAFSMKQEIIIGEVKSCWQDFKTDTKWHNYIKKCDKYYFIFSKETWDKDSHRILPLIEPHNVVGVIVVDLDRWWSNNSIHYRRHAVRVVKNAKKDELDFETRLWMITKLAYKGGVVSVQRLSKKRRK